MGAIRLLPTSAEPREPKEAGPTQDVMYPTDEIKLYARPRVLAATQARRGNDDSLTQCAAGRSLDRVKQFHSP
jgi:hypothetical protein